LPIAASQSRALEIISTPVNAQIPVLITGTCLQLIYKLVTD
jgi:hypothetical protein